jgi:hypothetical protein
MESIAIDSSDSKKMEGNHHASGTSVVNDEKLHAASSTAYSSLSRSIDVADSNGTLMTDITATDNANSITDSSKPSEAMRCRRLEMNRASAKARRSNQKWLVENLTNEVSELREKLTHSQRHNVELMKSNAQLNHALVLQQQARQQQQQQNTHDARAQAQALLQPDLLTPNACLQQIQRLKSKMQKEQQQHGQRGLLKQQLLGGGNNNNTNTNVAFLGSLLQRDQQQREQQQAPHQHQQQQQQQYQQRTNQHRMPNFVVGNTTTSGLPITTALKTTEQLLAHSNKSAATSTNTTNTTIQPLDIRMLPPQPVPLPSSSYSQQQQQQNVKMEVQQLSAGAFTSLVSSLGTLGGGGGGGGGVGIGIGIGIGEDSQH